MKRIVKSCIEKINNQKLLFTLCLILCLIVPATCKKLEKSMLVSTGEISSISTNTAEASGEVIDLGVGATQHGHCYSTTFNVTTAGSKTQLGKPAGTGGFTSQLTGLEAGTKYYVKAYLTNGTETTYGKEISFTTTAASLPTITTTVITAITTTTATSGGNIISDGGAPVTIRGVCWNAATGPTVVNSKTSDGSGTGSYSSSITDLVPGTLYYVRAYATNSAGTVYGNEETFTANDVISTVPGAPTIGTATAGNAQATITFTAPVSDGGSTITGYTVTSSPGGITGTGSASPIIVTGLTNGTAYTFTVTATNAIGTSAASAASNSVIPPGTVTNPTTGKIWMDSNLGASQVATSSTDIASYGDLYQWGRATDGHQIRTSGTTSTLSSTNAPGHSNFITYSNSPYDWRSPQNTNLWQGVNGVNNPCPTGFRIPTGIEWEEEIASWSSQTAAGAYASPLKLPAAGSRYGGNGSLSGAGIYGYYWSSTVVGTNSDALGFGSTFADVSNYYRAYGFSVRCIKDN